MTIILLTAGGLLFDGGNVLSTTKGASVIGETSHRREFTPHSIHIQVIPPNQLLSDTKCWDSKYLTDALDTRFFTAQEAVT